MSFTYWINITWWLCNIAYIKSWVCNALLNFLLQCCITVWYSFVSIFTAETMFTYVCVRMSLRDDHWPWLPQYSCVTIDLWILCNLAYMINCVHEQVHEVTWRYFDFSFYRFCATLQERKPSLVHWIKNSRNGKRNGATRREPGRWSVNHDSLAINWLRKATSNWSYPERLCQWPLNSVFNHVQCSVMYSV